jgi:hypothetical protein
MARSPSWSRRGGRTAQRVALISGAALLVLLIGFSRVAAGVHTPQEVAAGLLIGAMSIALYRALRAEPRLLAPPWRRIALAAPLVLALGFLALVLARHWTPEPLIDAIGRRLAARFGFCQGV